MNTSTNTGDGVFLTTLDPSLGKETVENNNWDGLAESKKGLLFWNTHAHQQVEAREEVKGHTGPLWSPAALGI